MAAIHTGMRHQVPDAGGFEPFRVSGYGACIKRPYYAPGLAQYELDHERTQ